MVPPRLDGVELATPRAKPQGHLARAMIAAVRHDHALASEGRAVVSVCVLPAFGILP